MSETFAMKNDIINKGEEFMIDTYSTTLTSINSAFGLATALAWTEAIKSFITNVMPKGSGHTHLVMYALVVTILYVAFMMLSNKKQERVNLTVAKTA